MRWALRTKTGFTVIGNVEVLRLLLVTRLRMHGAIPPPPPHSHVYMAWCLVRGGFILDSV